MEYIEYEFKNINEEFEKNVDKSRVINQHRKKIVKALKKCEKDGNILKIDFNNAKNIFDTYSHLDLLFSNLMRKNKLKYGMLLTYLSFEGDETLLHNIFDILAKTEQELEFAEMEKLTLKERLFGLLPTTLQYLIKDFKKYLKARKEGRQMIVPPEIASYRMEQCNQCEHLNPSILGKRCKICGCFLRWKTPLSFEECVDVNNVRWGEWREDE